MLVARRNGIGRGLKSHYLSVYLRVYVSIFPCCNIDPRRRP